MYHLFYLFYGNYWSLAFNVWNIITFLLIAIGLFLIAKNQKIEYDWLSFVPIANWWVMCKLAEKSFFTYFIAPLLCIFVSGMIIWLISYWFGVILFTISIILALIAGVIVLHGISERLGKSFITTILLALFPFVMFPYLAFISNK